jgi:hypothetical protein
MILIPKVEKVAVDAVCREVNIASQPMGDLMHLWAVELVHNDEPSVQDIVRLARSE